MVDSEKYSELLALHRPVVIETAEEHEHMLTVAESLMEKGESLTVEEHKLLTMVVLLVEAFEVSILQEDDEEEDGEQAEPPAPHDTLRRLIEARGLEAADLIDIFGNPQAAREALEGKRPITRGQGKELGRFFGVPDKLFRG